MVYEKCGGGPALVLVGQHGVVLVGGQLTVDRVDPGERWRRLASAPDLPERRPVDADGLGAGLTLVDGRRN